MNNPISLDGIDLLLGVPCQHQRIRESNMSQENTVERMTTEQVRKFLWDAFRDFDAGKITAVERGALVKAANKRLSDIRKERSADPQKGPRINRRLKRREEAKLKLQSHNPDR